jgi:ankyrin repeat protein
VNGKNSHGVAPLLWAAAEDKFDFVCLLLEAGAHVNEPDNHGMTPLMKAAVSGNIKTVRLLVERGADINAQAELGTTAWRLAHLKNYTDIETFLQETAIARACHAVAAEHQAVLRNKAVKLRLRLGGPS